MKTSDHVNKLRAIAVGNVIDLLEASYVKVYALACGVPVGTLVPVYQLGLDETIEVMLCIREPKAISLSAILDLITEILENCYESRRILQKYFPYPTETTIA